MPFWQTPGVSRWHISYRVLGPQSPLNMNKTGTRHDSGLNSPVSHRKASSAAEPDMIIIPLRDSSVERDGNRQYLGHQRHLEYTAFEEIETASSNADDELAFQEYADDDPSRLPVTARRQQA
jgi:hypothetical protein